MIEKILGREPHKELQNYPLKFKGRILVTGANGSIGQKLKEKLTGDVLYTDIDTMDATDIQAVRNVFDRFKPELVIHLAGAKHAPEGEVNPDMTFSINVLGTQNILEGAQKYNSKVVLASTCKSCNPETVYGASKLIAERMVLNFGGSVARFYNVVQTQGNVFEIWPTQETLKVAQCERFFIDIEESVGLTLFACDNIGRFSVNCYKKMNIVDVAQAIYPDKDKVIIKPRRGDRVSEPRMATSEEKECLLLNNSVTKIVSRND